MTLSGGANLVAVGDEVGDWAVVYLRLWLPVGAHIFYPGDIDTEIYPDII
jgi:hypothetical protein